MKLLGHCRNALSTYSTRLDSQGFPLSSTTCYQVLFFSTKVFRPRFQVIRKYDINRLPATYWLATDVTQVMSAMPSQKSKPPFKKKKKNTTKTQNNEVVPESDKKQYTQQQVQHRLDVLHCFVVFVSRANDFMDFCPHC